MKIDCELTQEETDALTFLMGFAMGTALRDLKSPYLAKMSLRLINKLCAQSPHYTPYEEISLDPDTPFSVSPKRPQ